MKLDQQSSRDLEFDKVKLLLSDFCKSNKARENSNKISPFNNIEDLKIELEMLEEIGAIYKDDSLVFPHPNAEDIDHALKLLDIENGVLILDELIKIYRLCVGTRHLIEFSVKNKTETRLFRKNNETKAPAAARLIKYLETVTKTNMALASLINWS